LVYALVIETKNPILPFAKWAPDFGNSCIITVSVLAYGSFVVNFYEDECIKMYATIFKMYHCDQNLSKMGLISGMAARFASLLVIE